MRKARLSSSDKGAGGSKRSVSAMRPSSARVVAAVSKKL